MNALETHEDAKREELCKVFKKAPALEKQIEESRASFEKNRDHYKAERLRLDKEEKEANKVWNAVRGSRLEMGRVKQELTGLFLRDELNRKRSSGIDRLRSEVKRKQRQLETENLAVKMHTKTLVQMNKLKLLPEERAAREKRQTVLELALASTTKTVKVLIHERDELEKMQAGLWRLFTKP